MELIAINLKCIASAAKLLLIEEPWVIYIPNSFSPNNDGKNEVFTPKGEGIETFAMTIYDRWGNLIFHTTDIEKGWNGKANGETEPAQIAVYVIEVIDTPKK